MPKKNIEIGRTPNDGTGDNLILAFAKVNENIDDIYTEKQDTLISGTNIKTINGSSVLGSGNLVINSGGNGTVTSVSALTLGTTGTDLSSSVANSTTTPVITLNVPTASAYNRGVLSSADWNTFNNKQDTLISGTNIKTVNSTSVLGSGNIAVQDTLVSGTNIKTINGNSVLGSGNLTISGGSGIGGLQGIIKVSGITMPFNPYGGLSTVAMIANRILLYPLIPAQDITISALTINVTTFLASANARILIYDNISGTYAPRNKILETTNLDCSTNGIKTFNYSYTFLKGEIYWFGVYSNLTPTVTAMSAGNMLNLRQDGIINVQQIESTYTFGTAPATYPTSVGYNNRSTVPNIGLVIA